MRIAGTFNGTGAALAIGLGFVPDWVKMRSFEDAEDLIIDWNVHMSRSGEYVEGVLTDGDDDANYNVTPLTKGNGIIPYYGGETFASVQTAYIALATDNDKRDAGSGDAIDTWTLGSSSNYTGDWGVDCSTTYVGEGSRICVDQGGGVVRWASVVALSNEGADANEVTLSYPLESGTINMLTGMYDFVGVAAGKMTPAGIYTADTTLNGSGDLCYIEAGTYGADR